MEQSPLELVAEHLDIVHAVGVLICLVVLPPLVRLRIVYTFLWAVFALLALAVQSPSALGLATSMGLTVMLSWYRLRVFDHSVFDSVLLGWFGFLSKYRAFRWLASTGDFLLHFVFPVALTIAYLPLVQLWMTVPIMMYVLRFVLSVDTSEMADSTLRVTAVSRLCGCTWSRTAR